MPEQLARFTFVDPGHIAHPAAQAIQCIRMFLSLQMLRVRLGSFVVGYRTRFLPRTAPPGKCFPVALETIYMTEKTTGIGALGT